MIRAVLLTVFLLLTAGSSLHDAPTFDEPLHITSGYLGWTQGGPPLEQSNPVLIGHWMSLPLLALRLDLPHMAVDRETRYGYAIRFIFHNRLGPDAIVGSARWMIILLGLLLGALIWKWADESFGSVAAIAALGAYVFSPTVLAHAHLATIDVASALGSTLMLYLLYRYSQQGHVRQLLAAGAALGAAAATKYSLLGFLPWVLLLIILFPRSRFPRTLRAAVGTTGRIALFLSASVGVVLICYHITGCTEWWDNLQFVMREVRKGYSTYFWGQYREGGVLGYFWVAYLLKTPIPFLVCVGAGIALAVAEKYPKQRQTIWFVLGPSLWFLLLASLSNAQRGVRHILPVYPLHCLWIGGTVHALWNRDRRPWVRNVCLAAGLWMVLETLFYFPNYISYFNQLAGGPSGGYRYLAESNVDWGQGLKALGRYLEKHHIKSVALCYFGCADPATYGIHYRPVLMDTCTNMPPNPGAANEPPPQYLAISLQTLLKNSTPPNTELAHLRASKPVARLAGSIWIYEGWSGRADGVQTGGTLPAAAK